MELWTRERMVKRMHESSIKKRWVIKSSIKKRWVIKSSVKSTRMIGQSFG
jgi:hypothetical protein